MTIRFNTAPAPALSFFAATLLCAVALSACGSAEDLDDEDLQNDCAADDERVGTSADFNTHFHNVTGTVTVVDNCTLRIDDFTFDGGGLDVRVFASATGDFANGVSLSNDLRNSEGYDGESITVKLPKGVALDDVGQVSIWCVTAAENFGDATLY